MARLQQKKQAAVTTDPMGGGWAKRGFRIGLPKPSSTSEDQDDQARSH
jgi:hypothetical protein